MKPKEMAGNENVAHQATLRSYPINNVGHTDISIQSAEDDLRRLDRELDQRIYQVLKLTHPPKYVPQVKIAKPPAPRPSQKSSSIPPHIYNTGGIISIRNGQVEGQGKTTKTREEERSVDETVGGSMARSSALTRGRGLDVGGESEWDAESALPPSRNELNCEGIPVPSLPMGTETPQDITVKQNRSETHDERNVPDHCKENVKGGRSSEDSVTNEENYINRGNGDNAAEHTSNENRDSGESDEEIDNRDAIFDEFLDSHTRGKIHLLTTRVAMLTQALQTAKEECVSLSNQKREMSRAVQEGESERRVLSKRVTALQQDSARLTRTNTQLNTRVKELATECQALRKEASSVRQREGEKRGNQSTLQAQLSRARTHAASLRGQLTTLTTRHKEEVKELRGKVEEAEKKWREVERARRNVAALSTKQQRLIDVLEKQKSNIAAGKAVNALEEKFLATIAPIQPH